MDDQDTKQENGYLVEVKQKGVVEKHRYSDRGRALQEIRRIPEEENLVVGEVNMGRTLLVEKKKSAKKHRKRPGDSEKALPESPRRGPAIKRAILFGGILGSMLLAPLVLLMGTGVGISKAPDFVPAPQAPRVSVTLSGHPAPVPQPEPTASESLQPAPPLENGIAAMLPMPLAVTDEPGSFPYTVHAGSYRHEARAAERVAALRENGHVAFAAYVEIPGMGGWFRAFCGNYPIREAALACKEQLKAQGVTDISVAKKSVALAVDGPLPLEDALALEGRLHAKGFFAYAMPRLLTDGRVQVLVGAFQSENRAEEMLELLTEEGFQVNTVKR